MAGGRGTVRPGTSRGEEAVPHANRPGDVLGGRYTLVDLLNESRGGRFWRARDQVLSRHVALHVIAADDDRAPGLLEAARRAAGVQDRRMLRVLDADERDGQVYVVNEWGTGTSLDVLVAEQPLAARRAAWIVSEVADALVAAHAAGVPHGHLCPESVLVDHVGSVRIIGHAVDAALRGRWPASPEDDVVDLVGLLYTGLTGRWAGRCRSEVEAAPVEHDRVLRPRQVRAGIPRTLDRICERVLDPSPGEGLPDVAELDAALRDFVGDPLEMAAAEAARGHTLPPRVDLADEDPGLVAQHEPDPPAAAPTGPEDPTTAVEPPPAGPGPADEPTVAVPVEAAGPDPDTHGGPGGRPRPGPRARHRRRHRGARGHRRPRGALRPGPRRRRRRRRSSRGRH